MLKRCLKKGRPVPCEEGYRLYRRLILEEVNVSPHQFSSSIWFISVLERFESWKEGEIGTCTGWPDQKSLSTGIFAKKIEQRCKLLLFSLIRTDKCRLTRLLLRSNSHNWVLIAVHLLLALFTHWLHAIQVLKMCIVAMIGIQYLCYRILLTYSSINTGSEPEDYQRFVCHDSHDENDSDRNVGLGFGEAEVDQNHCYSWEYMYLLKLSRRPTNILNPSLDGNGDAVLEVLSKKSGQEEGQNVSSPRKSARADEDGPVHKPNHVKVRVNGEDGQDYHRGPGDSLKRIDSIQ